MSWINSDSFQNYDDVTLEYSASSTAVITAGVGRHGLAGIVTNGTTFFTDDLIVLNEQVLLSGLVHGIALQLTSLPASEVVLFQYRESDDTIQDTITITTGGNIKAYKGDVGGTLLGTSTDPLAIATYYYIESKVTIDNATGTVEVKVGISGATTTVITFTGDTQNGGTGLISKVSYGVSASSPTGSWCDKYTCDLTGSAFNDFLGNKSINAYLPDGAGFYTQWQPFPSAPNFGNVDENPPNGDTSYNFAPSETGDTDTFSMENTMATTVNGVMLKLCTKLSAADAQGVAGVMRLSSTDSVTAQIVPSTSYFIYQFPFETDPLGNSWTAANFNSSEAGYSVNAAITYWLLPYLAVYTGTTPVAVTANDRVQVLRVFIPYNMLVSRITMKVGTSSAGKSVSAGLYSEDGNTLVIDSGPFDASTTGLKSVTFSPVLVAAGMYWYAWTSDSTIVTLSAGTIDLNAATIREANTEQIGFVANASVGGQLPSTMGAFTPQSPAADSVPLTGLH